MDAGKLLDELQSIEPAITGEQLNQWLIDNKRAAANVTVDEILTIAEALAPKQTASLAVSTKGKGMSKQSKGGAATKPPKESDDRQSRTQSPNSSAIQQTNEEINAFKEVIVTGIDRYVASEGDALVSVIREAPNKLISHVNGALEDGAADPAHFRRAGEELLAALGVNR